jgi:hypothetical protein
MKISNVGVSSTPPAQQPVDSTAAANQQAAPPSVAAASSYTPSPQLMKLVDLVRQESDVRPDLVLAATQRLQQGDYGTSAAADQTAAAMLDSLD